MGCCKSREVSFPQKPPREPLSALTPTLLESASLATEPFHHSPSLSSLIASSCLHSAATLTSLSNKVRLRAQITQETLTSGSFLDSKAREIEEYILNELDFVPWKTVESQDSIEIALREGSKYHSQVPVFRISAEISSIVKASFVMAMLENPDFRTQWDLTVREMTVLYEAEENSYMRNYIQRWNQGVEEREVVEKCQVKLLSGCSAELRQVYYSVEDPVSLTQYFPLNVRIPRVHTYFGLVQLLEGPDSLFMRLFLQCDMQQCNIDTETQLAYLLEWTSHMREVVETRSY